MLEVSCCQREVQCCHCTATIPIIKSSTEPANRALFHILSSFSKVRHGSSTSFTRLDPQYLSLLFHVLFNQSSRPVLSFSDLIRFVFVCSDPARDEFQTEILTYLRNFSLSIIHIPNTQKRSSYCSPMPFILMRYLDPLVCQQLCTILSTSRRHL